MKILDALWIAATTQAAVLNMTVYDQVGLAPQIREDTFGELRRILANAGIDLAASDGIAGSGEFRLIQLYPNSHEVLSGGSPAAGAAISRSRLPRELRASSPRPSSAGPSPWRPPV